MKIWPLMVRSFRREAFAINAEDLANVGDTSTISRCVRSSVVIFHVIFFLFPLLAACMEDKALDLLGVGVTHLEAGKVDEASLIIEAAIELCERNEDLYGKAHALFLMGTVKSREGEFQDALLVRDQSVKIFRRLQDPVGMWASELALGETYHGLGRLDEASKALSWAYESLLRMQQLDPQAFLESATVSFRLFGFAESTQLEPSQRPELLRSAELMTWRAIFKVERDRKNFEPMLAAQDRMITLLGVSSSDVDSLQTIRLLREATASLEAGETRQALATIETVLELCRQTVDLHVEAHAFFLMGNLRRQETDFEKALDAYGRSAAAFRKLGNLLDLSQAEVAMGEAYHEAGRSAEALKMFNQASETLAKIVDSGSVISAETCMVDLHINGYPPERLAMMERLLMDPERRSALQTELLRGTEILILTRIATVERDRQAYEKAALLLERALNIVRSAGLAEAEILGALAEVKEKMDRWDDAATYYEEALATFERFPDRALELRLLDRLAQVEQARGRREAELSRLQQAQEIAHELGDLRMAAKIHLQIAGCHVDFGSYEQMMSHAREAMTLARAAADPKLEKAAELIMGLAFSAVGNLKEVEERFEKFQSYAREVEDEEARTLAATMPVVLALDQLSAENIPMLQRALALAKESSQHGMEGTIRCVLGLTYYKLDRYDEAQDELEACVAIMEAEGDGRDEPVAALMDFAYSGIQRDELQATVRRLEEASTTLEVAFEEIQAENLLSSFSSVYLQGIYDLLTFIHGSQGNIGDAFAYAERTRARTFLKQVSEDRGAPRIKVDESHPEYASLFGVEPLSLSQAQTLVLDGQTSLVVYHVPVSMPGASVVAWVIDRHEAKMILLDQLTAQHLPDLVEYVVHGIRSQDFDFDAAGDLYRKLVAPLAPHLRHRNVVLVPDGILYYLPFAALWNAEEKRFLVEEHALAQVPSVSVLRFLAEKRTPNDGRVLVLGNPDGSLPHAEEEAEAIAQLFGIEPLLRRDASERQIRVRAGEIDVLHVAAHGVYDPQNPQLSRIELAPGGAEDGHLEVHEIISLDLRGADLVVLSACETSLGELSRGDDLIGMSRAFLYAGSPAVVTTLWSIDDMDSRVFMEGFYRHLKSEKTTVAEALQKAQMEVMAQERWREPYFWAAFVLTGDHRTWVTEDRR